MKFKTLLEIDLKKLYNNTKILVDSYNDYKYKFANLKDNAYGMGLEIVNALVKANINYVYVGSLKDALDIRKYNQEINILVNYFIDIEEIYDAINNNISITISSIKYLKKVNELKLKDDLKVQILIDNGSNKLGISSKKELKEIIEIINNNKHLLLEGFYSDLTSIGVEDEYYYHQVNNFYSLINEYLKEDLIVHLNEPLMYHKKLDYINGIRFDLALFGIEENINENIFTNWKIKNIEKKYGDLEFPNIDLKLIFSITSEVMQVGKVKKGELIGRKFIAKEDLDIAIIPIGHKDGITKAIKYVGINGFKRDIIADEIDYIIVSGSNINIFDKVYIVNEERDIYDFLTLLKTNRYYLMSVLNRNLTKIYINDEYNKGDLL
ncbi:MAG: alanine racemase [Bacilli bacterium]